MKKLDKQAILDLEINNVCYCTKCKKTYSVKFKKHCSLKDIACQKCNAVNCLLWFCWDYNNYSYLDEIEIV